MMQSDTELCANSAISKYRKNKETQLNNMIAKNNSLKHKKRKIR